VSFADRRDAQLETGRLSERTNDVASPAIDTSRAIPAHGVSFREAFWTWARVAALSFGGPAGQIAVMHRIIVDEKKWVGETRFLHALNYCMLLPGPEATQLAVYIGWLMHRTAGGIVAGVLFVLPGMAAIMALSWIYAAFGTVSIVRALFFGLTAAVLAIVLEAVVRIGKRALRNGTMVGIAAAAFIAIFGLGIAFPWIIAAAGVIGYVGHRMGIAAFQGVGGHASGARAPLADADSRLGAGTPAHTRVSGAWSLKVLAISLALWFGPLLVIAAIGGGQVYLDVGAFFSKMAVVTFGGAYAVLAYVAQEAVDRYQWLQAGEMLTGLGMAETTPGPLIMVLQFVGFMASFRDPGPLSPLLAGTLGGLLATWVTFVPCFLWIFAGAPYIEALRGNKALGAALSAVTAAVVGVILNLAIWFALHTLFRDVVKPVSWLALELPVPSSVDPWSLAFSLAAIVALFRFKVGMIPMLLVSALAGIVVYLAGGLR
jgi:chromate transporter